MYPFPLARVTNYEHKIQFLLSLYVLRIHFLVVFSLQQCGPIAEVRLIKTRQSQKGNVYAYVEFTTPGPVQEALSLDKTELDGRTMFVSPFKEKKRNEVSEDKVW